MGDILLRTIMHYFSSKMGFTNIDVLSTRQSGAETKYGFPTVRGQWGLTMKATVPAFPVMPSTIAG